MTSRETTTRETPGPTPNGGVKAIAYFTDDDGAPADESVATHIEIVELDPNDEVIHRTYGLLTH